MLYFFFPWFGASWCVLVSIILVLVILGSDPDTRGVMAIALPSAVEGAQPLRVPQGEEGERV